MRPGSLRPRIEVKFIATLPASQVNEPAKHLSPKASASRRLARDQVIHVQEFSPGEIFQNAKPGAAQAFTFLLQIREAKAARLLPLHASQE